MRHNPCPLWLWLGSHILSGAVLEPRAFDVLFPEWQRSHGPDSEDPAPLLTPAITDKMLLLTEKRAYPLPKLRQLNNHGNWIVSLSEVTRWMGRRAEELGISLFPGFAGRHVGAAKLIALPPSRFCTMMPRNVSWELARTIWA